jgi:uncharacterized protein (DUF362 family)
MKNTRNDSQRISRRDFLKVVTVTGAAGLLAGCRPASLPTAVASTLRHPEIIKFYPDAPSKVVQTRHAGVWKGTPRGGAGDNALLNPQALRQMLDASITELTGLDDASAAWAALFAPNERIGVKVNTIEGSEVWTHVPLAMAVAESLQSAGVPAEQIIIFDRRRDELVNAGYTINEDGPGVRCYGTGGHYTAGWQIADTRLRLSNILLQCDALINMPVYKGHGHSGISFAMKNHYGTLDRPEDFHRPLTGRAIAELNALTPIKDRTRLVIGDILTASTTPRESSPYWTLDAVGDSILMSFDVVAHDATGLQMLPQLANSGVFRWASQLANPWLKNSAELGVGTNDPKNIEFVELKLG